MLQTRHCVGPYTTSLVIYDAALAKVLPRLTESEAECPFWLSDVEVPGRRHIVQLIMKTVAHILTAFNATTFDLPSRNTTLSQFKVTLLRQAYRAEYGVNASGLGVPWFRGGVGPRGGLKALTVSRSEDPSGILSAGGETGSTLVH
ncbi:hypothetical protein CVT26_015543 [Gymnopilus dilepis]|uniref:Uncharacterized protein n=1 Tax=Gymnopilus dilepis TaxID=231916 RepID=A0A409YD86_9AGAR|nr:hypothetical protein CVT26_015543 [Gymnopilus dilepis]